LSAQLVPLEHRAGLSSKSTSVSKQWPLPKQHGLTPTFKGLWCSSMLVCVTEIHSFLIVANGLLSHKAQTVHPASSISW
jgi:hypothetical protein